MPHCMTSRLLFSRAFFILIAIANNGVLHSLVVRQLWELDVGGSNPSAPTNFNLIALWESGFFFLRPDGFELNGLTVGNRGIVHGLIRHG